MPEVAARTVPLALLTFGAPPRAQLPAALARDVGGEALGHVVASALPVALASRLRRKAGLECNALHLGMNPAGGESRMRLLPVPLDAARLADFGRSLSSRRLAIGEFAAVAEARLHLMLIDCERRRVAVEATVAAGGGLRRLFADALRFFARDAALAPGLSEAEFAAAAEGNDDAFLWYLRALHVGQHGDAAGRPAELESMLLLLTNALSEDPDFEEAALALNELVLRWLLPQERGWLEAQATPLLEAAARASGERAEVVFALISALLPVVAPPRLLALLERPFAATHELRRRVARAQLLELLGRREEARAELAAAQALAPDDDALENFAARLDEEAGDAAAARRRQDRILARSPDDALALEGRVRALASEDAAAALALAARVLAPGRPVGAALLEALAGAAERAPAFAAAALAKPLAQLRVDEQAPAELLAALGRLFASAGQAARAEMHFLIALERGLPAATAARVAWLLARPGDVAGAAAAESVAAALARDDVAAAQAALASLPPLPAFWRRDLFAAEIRAKQGELAAAQAELEALLPRAAGDGEVHAALARTLARAGRRDAAIAAFETACGKRRADTSLRVELAELHLAAAEAEAKGPDAAGHRGLARTLLADVLAHAPGDARARSLLARVNGEGGEAGAASAGTGA
jgi:hypothetical protein